MGELEEHVEWLQRTARHQIDIALRVVYELGQLQQWPCPLCQEQRQHKETCLVSRAKRISLGLTMTGMLQRGAEREDSETK